MFYDAISFAVLISDTTGMELVYDNLRLHVSNDAFYVESLNAGANDVLVIDRINHEINLQSNKEDIPPSLAESEVCI